MSLIYGKDDGWILEEDRFDPRHLGKCESIMALGNGYMGLRSATEEAYVGQTRDLLVNGTFDRFDEEEVTELPNAADVTEIGIWIDGERFSLLSGNHEGYSRELDVRNGLLSRKVTWITSSGKRVRFAFQRLVSLERLHDIALTVSITPEGAPIDVRISTGIDGQVTNEGSQHFSEGEKRLYENRYLQMVETTRQSGIGFVVNAVHRFEMDGDPIEPELQSDIGRRRISTACSIRVEDGSRLSMAKFANVYTTRDLDTACMDLPQMQEASLEALKESEAIGFDGLLARSAAKWDEQVWGAIPISIEGDERSDLDIFAIRFAQYHMRIMDPRHDDRMNIGAKGLTGEGYKGHTFWDTEIFLLPYYMFCDPVAARKLETYRYLSLPGAHRKAAENGYEGAMFPWESAWIEDGETCPLYGGTDIVTGMTNKIWSGIIEQHITSDVAFGVWQYYEITGDEGFMRECGYELVMDTAIFWTSRLEPGDDGMLHINDVVGPDEYHEHVNDNAFTNYMARWTISKAIEYRDMLHESDPSLLEQLDAKLDLGKWYPEWCSKVDRIYLPLPDEDHILPMDDRFLTLADIDLSKYKEQEGVGGIMRDFNLEQIQGIQVSKQADVLVLFFLMEDLFGQAVKEASFGYYEPRTLHDSSLSLSTHAVLAADLGLTDMAYELFRKASMIDLGQDMGSSDMGVHAASFGGIWEAAIYGFGGLRMVRGELLLRPHLPSAWDRLSYRIHWRGQVLDITVTEDEVSISNRTGTDEVKVVIDGEPVAFTEHITRTLDRGRGTDAG